MRTNWGPRREMQWRLLEKKAGFDGSAGKRGALVSAELG